MEKVQIKVTYDGIPSSGIDDKVGELMKNIGAKWYAQGFDREARKRDIVFDLELNIGE